MTTSTLFEPGTAPASNPTSNWEVGTRFTTTASGAVTRIRYYKLASEGGSHTGKLWDGSGTLLGSVAFTGETSSGWQEATLATPIAIAPGQTYTVSVNINSFTPSWSLSPPQPNTTSQLNTTSGAYNIGSSGGYPGTNQTDSFYGQSVLFDDAIATPMVLSQPTLTATNAISAGFTITVSGGTSPYTAQLHRSVTSGFTPSGGTAIAGASVSGSTI